MSNPPHQTQQGEARERVEAILTAVRERGDAAIADFTERFDGFRPEPMAVPKQQLEQAWTSLPTTCGMPSNWPIAASANSTNASVPPIIR